MFSFMDYVYEVYKEKSFTLAARKLLISQPALSASVKKVEEKLGTAIFDRNSSPMKLTEAGKAYVEAVEQIRAIEDNLKNKIADIGNLKVGTISIGCANLICTCIVPELLKRYTQNYPDIKLNLTESSSEDLKNKMASGTLDAVIDYEFDENIFKSYPLKKENILIAVAKNSPIANKFAEYLISADEIASGEYKNKQAIDIALLKGENFIVLKKKNDMQRRAMRIFHEAEMEAKIVLELDQLKTAYELSCAGLGLSFVTDTLILHAGNENGAYFKISSPFATRTISIAHGKNIYVSNSLSKFVATAVQCFSE